MSLGVGDPFVSFSDKSYFEISEQDIKEMWENDTLNMVFEERVEPEADAWTNGSEWEDSSDVVLHDRMMSDSGLYKHEHSYSLAEGSGRSRLLLHAASSSSSSSHSSMMAEDDMEKECFPAISMKCEEDSAEPRIVVKGEPVSRSNSPEMEVLQEKSRYLKLNVSSQSLLKHPTVYLTPTKSSYSTRVVLSRADVRMELGNARSVYPLPPTPPSSCTSDCEGNQSPLRAPGSPDDCRRTPKLLCAPAGGGGRQLISTPLISSQPRGATGVLVLTEEEKRTLIAEGYPVPTKLPLTKAEERSLKKIRRKIKNKESRRKKKEYMDHLERKVELLVSENVEYRKQLTLLEAANASLQHQLQQLYEERKKAAATSVEDH